MRAETRHWILKAEKDLSTAGFAFNSVDGPLPVTTALHCQRSAEKYLKAFLQEHQIAFSGRESLSTLFESCLSVDGSLEALRMEIEQLEGYSIALRYPQADASHEFREKALAVTNRVKEFILSKIT